MLAVFFPTRAARFTRFLGTSLLLCLPDPTAAVERAGDAAHR